MDCALVLGEGPPRARSSSSMPAQARPLVLKFIVGMACGDNMLHAVLGAMCTMSTAISQERAPSSTVGSMWLWISTIRLAFNRIRQCAANSLYRRTRCCTHPILQNDIYSIGACAVPFGFAQGRLSRG